MMESMQKLCSECGAAFECKQATGCWCAELPWTLPVPPDKSDPAKGCLCPECLAKRLGVTSQPNQG